MKLPLLEQLKTRKFPQAYAPRHSSLVNLDTQRNPSAGPVPHLYDFRTTVELGYTQRAREDEQDRIHERGTAEVMRAVYGPVSDELVKVVEELRHAGLSTHDVPVTHLWKVIDTLRGTAQ